MSAQFMGDFGAAAAGAASCATGAVTSKMPRHTSGDKPMQINIEKWAGGGGGGGIRRENGGGGESYAQRGGGGLWGEAPRRRP